MPILADLSRRLHLLTTDAKPDPPRIDADDNTHNIRPRKLSQRSAPPTPEVDGNEPKCNSYSRQNSTPDSESRRNSGEKKIPRYKTKQHSSKNGQTANIVNYNIVNSNGVKIGSTTTYVCNVNQYSRSPPREAKEHGRTSPKTKTPPMPEDVESLCRQSKLLTIEDMFLMKTHLGHGWKDVFKSLGYSDGQLEQFEEHHKSKGLDEVIYQTLLDWKQSTGSEGRLGVLIRVLWRCQQFDCVERLAEAHKNLNI